MEKYKVVIFGKKRKKYVEYKDTIAADGLLKAKKLAKKNFKELYHTSFEECRVERVN